MPLTQTRSRLASQDERDLYDRDTALDILDAAYQRAESGRLVVVTVAGEAGLGKTRLMLEFENRLKTYTPRPLVAYGRALAANSIGNGFQPLREALADLLSDTTTTNSARLKNFLRSMRAVAPEWLAALPAVGSIARAAALTLEEVIGGDTGGVSTSVNAQFSQLVEQMTTEGTLVLLLDDLHWADDSTVDLLFFLSQQLTNSPLMLVLAYRPMDLYDQGRTHSLRQMLLRMERYQDVQQIELGWLSRMSIAYLARKRLGMEPSSHTIDWIAERSEGNPLFVHEYLELLIDKLRSSRRMVSRECVDEILSSIDDIPRRLTAVLEERLESLTADELRALQLAAVVGQTFTIADIIAMGDLGEEAARRALRNLSQRSGLIRAAKQATYAFFHGLIREHTINQLRDNDQVDYADLHYRRAKQLEISDVVDFDRLEDLAYHYHESVAHQEALTYAGRAGEAARALGAVSEAGKYFSWMVWHADQLGSPRDQIASRRNLAAIDQELVRTDCAVQRLQEARSIAERAIDMPADPSLLFDLARAYRMEERWADSRETLNAACAIVGSKTLQNEAAIALLAGELALSGQPRDIDEAEAKFATAAEFTADPFLLASVFGHLGFVALAREDVATAQTWFTQAREQAYLSGRPGRIYEAHLWQAKLDLATLRLHNAGTEIRKLVEMSEIYGVAATVAHHYRDSGRRAVLLGDLETALPAYASYLERMLSVGSEAWRIRAQCYFYLQTKELIEERGKRSTTETAQAISEYLFDIFADSAIIASLVAQLRVTERALREGTELEAALTRAGLADFLHTKTAEAARWVFTFHINDLSVFRRRYGFSLG